MPPRRDAFALVLSTLRRRLRQGVDAPGQALPINQIAADLRLSTTPVREALSRLAGEGVVEKHGPTYTRPRLDGVTLGELYRLRTLYLAPAVAHLAARPGREPMGGARDLADRAAPGVLVEALFLDLVLGLGDRVLAQAYQATAERLAPFQLAEARLMTDLAEEALVLTALAETLDQAGLRAGLRRYHRRRIAQADLLARLAEHQKYRTDIV